MRASNVSVVIVSWDGLALLDACLSAVYAQTLQPHEVIVVDNGSVDGTATHLASLWPDVRVVALPFNTGFAAGANAGIRATTSELVALLNNDVVVDATWLDHLLPAFDDPGVGFAAPKILDQTGKYIDSAGDYIDRALTAHQRGHGQQDDGRWDEPGSLLVACAAATVYRTSLFAETGGFDERFFAYFEDADLCLRAAAMGWSGRYEPRAVVRHAVSATSTRIPGFKRYQGTRNAWWVLARAVPPRLLLRVVPRFLITQMLWLRGAWRVRELGPALRGHRDGLKALPEMIRSRGTTCPSRTLWSQLAPLQVMERHRVRFAESEGL